MSTAERRGGKLTGFWYGVVDRTHSGGIRFRRRFETKAKADAYEAYVRLANEEPPGFDPESGPVCPTTFKDIARMAEEHGGPKGKWKRGRSQTDANRRHWVGERFAKVPANKLTTAHLDALVTDLEKRPGQTGEHLDNDTINRYLAAVSGILKWARSRNLVETRIHIPWLPSTGGRILWLTEAQEEAIVAHMRSKGHLSTAVSVRVLCASGMRWGEFERMDADHIAPAGDGEHDYLNIDHTKTDTPRRVPIRSDIADEFRAILRANDVPDYYSVRQVLSESLKSGGVDEAFTIHCMRHTTATRFARDGKNAAFIQKFMGHKTLQTTMRYIHLFDDALLEGVKNRTPQRGV